MAGGPGLQPCWWTPELRQAPGTHFQVRMVGLTLDSMGTSGSVGNWHLEAQGFFGLRNLIFLPPCKHLLPKARRPVMNAVLSSKLLLCPPSPPNITRGSTGLGPEGLAPSPCWFCGQPQPIPLLKGDTNRLLWTGPSFPSLFAGLPASSPSPIGPLHGPSSPWLTDLPYSPSIPRTVSALQFGVSFLGFSCNLIMSQYVHFLFGDWSFFCTFLSFHISGVDLHIGTLGDSSLFFEGCVVFCCLNIPWIT